MKYSDRPCATCSSSNHGTGAHEKLLTIHLKRRDELELELAELPGRKRELELELEAIHAGLKRLEGPQSSRALEGS